MEQERLENFSLKELKAIAKKIGLDFEISDKQELIEDILEAYEEDKMDKQMGTNLAMLIKSKKFQLINDMDDFFLDQDDSEDPIEIHFFDESRIHLMLRDPHWGFAYWFFCKKDQKDLDLGNVALFLRVYKVKEGEVRRIKDRNHLEPDYFDISIEKSDTKWYINLPDTGYCYYVELLSQQGETVTLLAKSNMITSPALQFNMKFQNNVDDMLISSGIYESILSPGQDPSDEGDTMHRILSQQEQFLGDQGHSFKGEDN